MAHSGAPGRPSAPAPVPIPNAPQITSPASSGPGAARPARDPFLDLVKAIAVVRVVAWHTWGWWPLSWLAAMPAMFFVSGALLEQSLARDRWSDVVRRRMRRLLVPTWAYAVLALTLMVAAGWALRWSVVWWALPVWDPPGSTAMPSLWLPLWYLRAYLWVLLGSAALRRVATRWGWGVLAVPVALTLGLFAVGRAGREVPMPLTDAATFSAFVLAGMISEQRGIRFDPRRCLAVGTGLLLAAVAWQRLAGPVGGVVNASYPLHLIVGAALLAGLFGLRPVLAAAPAALVAAARWVSNRALTIYLWQGLALLAADRLVARRGLTGAPAALLSALVVVVALAGLVVVWAPLERRAAQRQPKPDRPPAAGPATFADAVGPARPWRLPVTAGRLAYVVPALAVLVAALVVAPTAGTAPTLIGSGQAVVARAGLVAQQQAIATEPDPTDEVLSDADPVAIALRTGDARHALQVTLDVWVAEHTDELATIPTSAIRASISLADGRTLGVSAGLPVAADDPVPLLSVTKTATAAWLVRLVEAGVVRLDDPVGRYVPEMPHGDEVTLEELARHRSGIPESANRDTISSTPVSDFREWATDGSLAFTPGTGFTYSRLGYNILGWALERASGTTWRAAMSAMAAEAGATVGFDEDHDALPDPTGFDGDGYHGRLFAAAGLEATPADTARLFRWIFSAGVSPQGADAMTRFSADPDDWYYGLGVMPICPCAPDGDTLSAERAGIDSLNGSAAVDLSARDAVFVAPDRWFADGGPVGAFFDLESRLLDTAARLAAPGIASAT